MEAFLAILLVGLTKWPSFELYWSTAVLFKCQVLEKCHRTSFWELSFFPIFLTIQLQNRNHPEHDRAYKIQLFSDKLLYLGRNTFMLERILQRQAELVNVHASKTNQVGAWKPGHYRTENRKDVPSKIKVEKTLTGQSSSHTETDTLYIFSGMTEGQ